MTYNTINGIPVEAITEHSVYKPELVQRISERKVKAPELAIVEPDPLWLNHFQTFKSRILAAFALHDLDIWGADPRAERQGSREIIDILSIDHVGSTSVPGLPAKAVIDIDLILSSNSLASEFFYVPRLEAAGFQFILREPAWHGHRFFCAWEPMSCNLHVWGPQSPEAERHRIFRDWLRENRDDRELYERTKKECAARSQGNRETIMQYNLRKQEVIREILNRAFVKLGYLS